MEKTALRQYLDLAGLTYREAARRTGLTHQSVFVHARGKSPIGAASALIYHRVFGISLEKLLTDRELPRPKRFFKKTQNIQDARLLENNEDKIMLPPKKHQRRAP